MTEKKFPVPGSTIEISDDNHPRGRMTAQLMGGNLGEGFQGATAMETAKKLIFLRVTPDQLDFLIEKDNMTPKEAVKFLEDDNNRLRLEAREQAEKGIKLPSHYQD